MRYQFCISMSGMPQVRSATSVEQVAACMLQLEASLRLRALSRDWDPLARLAARRAASEALPPVAAALAPASAPSPPVEAQPSTPQADAPAPGTPQTLSGELGMPYQPPMHVA